MNVVRRSISFYALCALLLSFPRGPKAEEASLCQKPEKVMFTCAIKGKPKLISVCLSTKKANAGYIKYRFGTKDNVELEYPMEYPEGSGNNFSAFKYSEEMRRSLVQSLSFSIGDDPKTATTYSVFGGQRPLETPEPRFFGGVRVQQGSAAVAKDIECRSPPTNRLDELKALVPQDE